MNKFILNVILVRLLREIKRKKKSVIPSLKELLVLLREYSLYAQTTRKMKYTLKVQNCVSQIKNFKIE